jgi:signal transduction histidine kinase
MSKGNGLINMKQRAEKLKGKLKIESENRNGTSVNCEIPINIT